MALGDHVQSQAALVHLLVVSVPLQKEQFVPQSGLQLLLDRPLKLITGLRRDSLIILVVFGFSSEGIELIELVHLHLLDAVNSSFELSAHQLL